MWAEAPKRRHQLLRTQETVLEALADRPLEITLGKGLTSIGAVLHGTGGTESGDGSMRGPRPAVLLPADMDPLPLQEETGLDFASEEANRIHACAHDLHTSMLVGAARLLAGHRADAAYGLHVVSTGGNQGRFQTMPGVIMSAADALFVKVIGRGGHGSAPHTAKDPVPVMAEMILALQHMVTRQFNAHDPVVVSVGTVMASEAIKVIPDTAEFGATLRMYSDAAREKLQTAIPRLLKGTASAHGAAVDVDYRVGGRVTTNDEVHTEWATMQITELFGEERHFRMPHPLGGSEDFAGVLAQVPGSFILLDASPQGKSGAEFNHSPRALFDDSVLADGAALYTQLAVERLTGPAGIRVHPALSKDFE